jgi:VIT1/CCC1 family predicted Fe2+/Mn2+ transporter
MMSEESPKDRPELDQKLRQRLIEAQHNEITEYRVYARLARRTKDAHNRDILQRIADEERHHYEFWRKHTGVSLKPKRFQSLFYVFIARFIGLTFAIKLMEKGEEAAQVNYSEIAHVLPEARGVLQEEEQHEHELMAILDEERLQYMGSIVLGLSDALVELTGALAGLTLALQDSRLIALIGLITGIAAAMSMAASEYLSNKADEKEQQSPLKAALYTGLAYIGTVLLLVLPYLLLDNPMLSLGIALSFALLIIVMFTYYLAVVRDVPFKHRFFEMAGLCLGVAAISFGIGFLLRQAFGIDL